MAPGDSRRGCGNLSVAPGVDVERVEVLGDAAVEVAEGQSGTADQPDAGDLSGIP